MISTGSWAIPGTTMDTAMASARHSTSSNADPTSTHQWGRRSRTTTSCSFSSRRGNGTGFSFAYGGVTDVVDVVAWVVVVALLVVVRAVVVVRPLVLVEAPGAVVVGAHGVLPTEPATWNGTCTTFDATLSPARSAGTVAGAASPTM